MITVWPIRLSRAIRSVVAAARTSSALIAQMSDAIPVLGFLGTVIGITLAIGKLSPQALEDSLPEVMTSLSVAFYTTTQALGLSIVLMFAQFLITQVTGFATFD